MIEEISEYYKEKGFDKVYVYTNKEPRRVAILRLKNGTTKSMSYAKYIYTSHHRVDIPKGFDVDHINNDRMDDKVANLQVLSRADNVRKSHNKPALTDLTCPSCGNVFTYEVRNLKFHKNPCCSMSCARRLFWVNTTNRHRMLPHKAKIEIDLNIVIEMHNSGKTYGVIAKELGVSLATLKRRMSGK